MKKLTLFWTTCLCLSLSLWSCSNDDDPVNDEVIEDGSDEKEDDGDDEETEKQEVVVSFEDEAGNLTDEQNYYLATEGEENGYYMYASFTDSQSLVMLSHYFSDWGFGGGFTYTNGTDTTTPGYNNLSAITGTGKNGTVYLTANSSSYAIARITNLNTSLYHFSGAWVTNTTYDYLSIKYGDDGGVNLVTPFTNGDYFTLTAIGYDNDGNETGRSTFYLADFRDGASTIVDTWEWFDWSELSDASYITFELESTDIGEYGMNTPSYFCMDGITLGKN